jgi:hypothetical protein
VLSLESAFARPRPQERLGVLGIIGTGQHQDRNAEVAVVQLSDHLGGALVGELHAYHGGVYAPLGHLLSALPDGADLRHHPHVGLPLHQVEEAWRNAAWYSTKG